MQDRALWLGIKDHPLVGSDGVTLERRLLRLGRLGTRRTRAVLEEYRRFLYLAAVAKGEVTPPLVLRQVWQIHAKDHAAYAKGLVAKVISRPMPEPFDAPLPASHPAHRRTRDLYRQEFGTDPMPALWPGPAAVLTGHALRVAVPGFALLAGWLILSREVPWAIVAGLGSLACLVVQDRVAPWVLRMRDTALDLDLGSQGHGGGVDFLGNGD
jgi:hypothetical protein